MSEREKYNILCTQNQWFAVFEVLMKITFKIRFYFFFFFGNFASRSKNTLRQKIAFQWRGVTDNRTMEKKRKIHV